MVISNVPRSVLAALLLAFAAPLAGCTVQTEAPAVYAGYEQNIDPEGAGYKKQAVLDTVKLTDGKVRIKI